MPKARCAPNAWHAPKAWCVHETHPHTHDAMRAQGGHSAHASRGRNTCSQQGYVCAPRAHGVCTHTPRGAACMLSQWGAPRMYPRGTLCVPPRGCACRTSSTLAPKWMHTRNFLCAPRAHGTSSMRSYAHGTSSVRSCTHGTSFARPQVELPLRTKLSLCPVRFCACSKMLCILSASASYTPLHVWDWL